MIESREDLNLEREQLLFARWATRRVQIERDLKLCRDDSTIPVSFKVDMDLYACFLDHAISRAPERARSFGEAAEEGAWNSLRLLEKVIQEIKQT